MTGRLKRASIARFFFALSGISPVFLTARLGALRSDSFR